MGLPVTVVLMARRGGPRLPVATGKRPAASSTCSPTPAAPKLPFLEPLPDSEENRRREAYRQSRHSELAETLSSPLTGSQSFLEVKPISMNTLIDYQR